MEQQRTRTNSTKNNFLKQKIRWLELTQTTSPQYSYANKTLTNTETKEKTPPWKDLATYWLAADIYKFTKDYKFLMDNTRTNTITNKKPYYYQDIIYYTKNENKDIQTSQNRTTKNIYKK